MKHQLPDPHADFAGSQSLDELVQLIEAIPSPFRPAIVQSALNFEPSGSFGQSYLVGLVRAAIAEVMQHRFGNRWWDQMQSISATDASVLRARLNPLASAHTAQLIRQQLIELLLPTAETDHALQ